MELIVWCGVSTFLWGALTGSFLGDLIPRLVTMLDPGSTFTMPALFTPLDDIVMIMIGSLVLGVVQILTGMTVSVVKKIRDGPRAGRSVRRGDLVGDPGGTGRDGVRAWPCRPRRRSWPQRGRSS